MKRRHLAVLFGALSFCCFARADDKLPEWYQAVDFFGQLLDPATVLAPMKDALAKFSLVFTGIGFAAVTISATLKFARARNSQESMGWVASTMMAIALMAIGPSIGQKVFDAADEVAVWSGYDMFDALFTTWDNVMLIVPPSSPAKDVTDASAAAKAATTSTAPLSAAPAASTTHWWDQAEAWAVSSWANVKDSVGGIFTAMKSIATTLMVRIMLIGTAIFLIIACIIILLGVFLREILHSCMDVFLPCMIGMLTFDVMRGAATTFVIRYISVAFWPVAWCLGNAIAMSLIESAGKWAVNASAAVIAVASPVQVASNVPALGPAAAGMLASAAENMAWGLILAILIAILFCGVMLIASAILAPIALTNVFTKGASFAGGLIKASAAGTAMIGGAAVSGGAAAVASGAAASAVSGAGGMASGLASRGASSLSGLAGRLSGMASSGGPLGSIAGAGASFLNRAASALQSAGNGAEGAAAMIAGTMEPGSLSGKGLATMMDTAGSLMSGAANMRIDDEHSVGTAAGALVGGTGRRAARAVARTYRWANDRLDN